MPTDLPPERPTLRVVRRVVRFAAETEAWIVIARIYMARAVWAVSHATFRAGVGMYKTRLGRWVGLQLIRAGTAGHRAGAWIMPSDAVIARYRRPE
jgi:hypothetical protein